MIKVGETKDYLKFLMQKEEFDWYESLVPANFKVALWD